MRVPDEKLIDRFPNNAALRTIQANPEKVIFMLRYLLAAEPYPMGAPDTVHALEQEYKLSPAHAKYRRNQAARLLEEGMIIEVEGRTRSALYRLTPFGKRLAQELIKAHGNLPPPVSAAEVEEDKGN